MLLAFSYANIVCYIYIYIFFVYLLRKHKNANSEITTQIPIHIYKVLMSPTDPTITLQLHHRIRKYQSFLFGTNFYSLYVLCICSLCTYFFCFFAKEVYCKITPQSIPSHKHKARFFTPNPYWFDDTLTQACAECPNKLDVWLFFVCTFLFVIYGYFFLINVQLTWIWHIFCDVNYCLGLCKFWNISCSYTYVLSTNK